MKVGDFFVSTWGWEQTNVSFYKIVKLTAKSVYLQEYGDDRTQTERGHYDAVPNMNKPYGEVFRKKFAVQKDGTPTTKISSYKYAHLWDGKPVDGTDYY